MIFSDETTAQNQPNNRRGWVFRKPHEAFQRALVNVTVHGKSRISLQAWAGIWRDGRSELIFLERDPAAPRGGYSAKSYQKALEEGLLPIYDGTRRFQQDNARIHNFGGTPRWLEIHGIEYIDWPPHSPDLNPIEHVWRHLKDKLVALFPHLHELSDNEAAREELRAAMKVAWAAIPQDLIRRLIESMPRRLLAVKRARGWYTKY